MIIRGKPMVLLVTIPKKQRCDLLTTRYSVSVHEEDTEIVLEYVDTMRDGELVATYFLRCYSLAAERGFRMVGESFVHDGKPSVHISHAIGTTTDVIDEFIRAITV